MTSTVTDRQKCSAGQDRQGVYLYCFARPGAASVCAGIETMVVQDVAVVFTRVSLADWEVLDEARLQDSDWLIPRALAHEEIIESQMATSPVLPVRFGSVFSCEAALVEFVAARRVLISHFLDSMAGVEEWAVKGLLDIELTRHWLQDHDAELAERWRRLPASPGARYFQEKRLKADTQKQARQWGYALAEQLSERLGPHAASVRTLRSRQVAGADLETVFNAAFLLPRTTVDAFHAEIERVQDEHASQGLTLQTTGPWPPYNFCPDLMEPPL